MAIRAWKKVLSLLLTAFIICQAGVVALADEVEERSGVEGFVERLYENIMERESDEAGLKFWADGLKKGNYTAASVVDSFFNSNEFTSKKMDDKEYIDILYSTIMGRECDESGSTYWVNELDKGTTRRRILSDFLWSNEFTEICSSYGVKKGTLNLNPIDLNAEKVHFLVQGYRAILGRDSDVNGLNMWLNYLLEGHTALEFIIGLVGSNEFINKNLDDSAYVACLYNALLGRDGTASEIKAWVDLMQKHQSSRMYILKLFSSTEEFHGICKAAGLEVGDVYATENRDINLNLTDYVINAFAAVFDRSANADELNFWTGALLTNLSGKDFVNDLLGTPEFTKRNLNNRAYVSAAMSAALGREVSVTDNDPFVVDVNANGRENFLNNIFGSGEFINKCKKLGIPAQYYDGWNNTPNGRIYVVDGNPVKGWQVIDNVKYYFDPSNNNAVAIGWHYIDGYKLYFNEDGSFNQDVRSIIGQQNSYYLTVNCTTNTVMVYAKDENGSYCVPVVAIICSTGVGGATPAGTFTTRRLGSWHPLMGDCYGQYCSQINGNILFHSVWYYQNGNPNTQSVKEYKKLGTSASHGCVRLTVADAKWIYDNCAGCTVKVFYGEENIPFDKPGVPEITPIYGDYAHDPTDIWR